MRFSFKFVMRKKKKITTSVGLSSLEGRQIHVHLCHRQNWIFFIIIFLFTEKIIVDKVVEIPFQDSSFSTELKEPAIQLGHSNLITFFIFRQATNLGYLKDLHFASISSEISIYGIESRTQLETHFTLETKNGDGNNESRRR